MGKGRVGGRGVEDRVQGREGRRREGRKGKGRREVDKRYDQLGSCSISSALLLLVFSVGGGEGERGTF